MVWMYIFLYIQILSFKYFQILSFKYFQILSFKYFQILSNTFEYFRILSFIMDVLLYFLLRFTENTTSHSVNIV